MEKVTVLFGTMSFYEKSSDDMDKVIVHSIDHVQKWDDDEHFDEKVETFMQKHGLSYLIPFRYQFPIEFTELAIWKHCWEGYCMTRENTVEWGCVKVVNEATDVILRSKAIWEALCQLAGEIGAMEVNDNIRFFLSLLNHKESSYAINWETGAMADFEWITEDENGSQCEWMKIHGKVIKGWEDQYEVVSVYVNED